MIPGQQWMFSKDVHKAFDECTDFASRISITLRALKGNLQLSTTSRGESKNNEESIKLRKRADQLVVQQKGRNDKLVLLEAREIYSKSIAFAKQSSTAPLAQAYANRSSALFNLNKFEECVRDIDRALMNSYPDHLKPNLLRRKAKCLKKLGDMDVDKVCEENRFLLEYMGLNDEKKEKLERKIDEAVKVTESSKFEYAQNRLSSFVPNPSFPSASEAIDLKYNKDEGRHFVATRDIKAGEVLIVEKPYASFLRLPYIYSYCSHCLARAWDSIPCEHCVYAMYCSQKCKDEAWKLYHDIECPIKKYFIDTPHIKADNEAFALKLTLLALREHGSIEKLKKELSKIDDCKGYLMKSFSEDGMYHSDKYRPVYSLLTHENNRELYEKFIMTVCAARTLYNVYTYTDLFGESDKSFSSLCENEDAFFFGQLFIQNYMKILINLHVFVELFHTECNKLATVITSVTSLVNHSCNPNVDRCHVFIDKAAHLVTFALHPILKGSPILDDYGHNFRDVPKSKRDELFSLYHFKCLCEACKGFWPMEECLPSILTIVSDKEKRVELLRSLDHGLRWKDIIYDLDIKFAESTKNPLVIFNDLTSSITTAFESTDKPSKEYFELLKLLKVAFTRYYGFTFEL